MAGHRGVGLDTSNTSGATVTRELADAVKLGMAGESELMALTCVVGIPEGEVPKRLMSIHDGLHFPGLGVHPRYLPSPQAHHSIVVVRSPYVVQVRAVLACQPVLRIGFPQKPHQCPTWFGRIVTQEPGQFNARGITEREQTLVRN